MSDIINQINADNGPNYFDLSIDARKKHFYETLKSDNPLITEDPELFLKNNLVFNELFENIESTYRDKESINIFNYKENVDSFIEKIEQLNHYILVQLYEILNISDNEIKNTDHAMHCINELIRENKLKEHESNLIGALIYFLTFNTHVINIISDDI